MKVFLIDKKKEASATWSFFFEPEKEVTYLAGQYYYFTLKKLNYPDSRGPTRHFTLSSSPTEGKLLRITTRTRESSGFKRTLHELALGTELEGEGPNGTFILDENEKGEHAFIAGGIGITPFRSMIKYKADSKIAASIHLLYSNSNLEEITFRKELEGFAKSGQIKLSMTLTSEKPRAKWDGLTGRIDPIMIRKTFTDVHKKTFWLVGPPKMVDGVEKVLEKLKINHSQIITEKFTGY